MIIESADVFAAIHKGLPYAVLFIIGYTILYCASYALLYRLLDIPAWKAFVPFYGQAVLFKKCGLGREGVSCG